MAIQTAKAGKLQQLAKSMPQLNDQVAQQVRETNKARIQDMIRQAPPEAATPQAAQQLGAQQAQASGAAAVDAAQTTANQFGQIGQLGVQDASRAQRAKAFDQSMNLREGQLRFANQLNALDSKYKNELLDNQLEFKKDEAGRTLFNERQLADYKISTAKSAEDLRNYQQQVQQFTRRKMKMYDVALSKINQKIQQEREAGDATLDREQTMQLKLAKKAIQDKIAKEQRKAAKRAAIYGGAGMALGAVAGGVASGGNPAAIQAGASLGQGAGQMAASSS